MEKAYKSSIMKVRGDVTAPVSAGSTLFGWLEQWENGSSPVVSGFYSDFQGTMRRTETSYSCS